MVVISNYDQNARDLSLTLHLGRCRLGNSHWERAFGKIPNTFQNGLSGSILQRKNGGIFNVSFKLLFPKLREVLLLNVPEPGNFFFTYINTKIRSTIVNCKYLFIEKVLKFWKPIFTNVIVFVISFNPFVLFHFYNFLIY